MATDKLLAHCTLGKFVQNPYEAADSRSSPSRNLHCRKHRFRGSQVFQARDNGGMRLPELLSTAASLSLSLCLMGCKNSSSNDKVAQAWSPDGQIVATLYEENGGATTSFGYSVTLNTKSNPEQKPAASLYGALRSREAYGVNLKWSDSSTLVLECFSLKGTPQLQTPVDLGDRSVAIKLRTGVEDVSAPSGGMAYNLKRSAH